MKKPVKVELINKEPIVVKNVEKDAISKNPIIGILITSIGVLFAILAFFGLSNPQKVIPVIDEIINYDKANTTSSPNSLTPIYPVVPIAPTYPPKIDYELLGAIFKYDLHPNSSKSILIDYNNNMIFQDDNNSGRYYTSWLNEYQDDKKEVYKYYNVENEIIELEMLEYVYFFLEKGMDLKEVRITDKGKEIYKEYLVR